MRLVASRCSFKRCGATGDDMDTYYRPERVRRVRTRHTLATVPMRCHMRACMARRGAARRGAARRSTARVACNRVEWPGSIPLETSPSILRMVDGGLGGRNRRSGSSCCRWPFWPSVWLMRPPWPWSERDGSLGGTHVSTVEPWSVPACLRIAYVRSGSATSMYVKPAAACV